MYVNPFWLGVLITIVSGVIAIILFGLIFGHREEMDDDEAEDKLAEALTKVLEFAEDVDNRRKDGENHSSGGRQNQ